MPISRGCRRAAFLLIFSIGCSGSALAQGTVEAPAYRPLGASELMTPPGQNGTDYSANPPSLAGLTLLATIPAAAKPQRKIEIYANCAAGILVVLDDPDGALPATIIPVDGPGVDGRQGGYWGTTAHSGRIRIYSSSATCQMAARVW